MAINQMGSSSTTAFGSANLAPRRHGGKRCAVTVLTAYSFSVPPVRCHA